MDRERLAWLRLTEVIVDALVIGGTWTAVVYARALLQPLWPLDLFPTDVLQPVSAGVHLPLLGVVVPLWVLALWMRGRYRDRGKHRPGDGLASGTVVGLLALLALIFTLKLELVSRTVVGGFALLSIPLLAASRVGVRRLLGRASTTHRVLLVGRCDAAGPFLDAVARHPEWGLAVIGRLGPGHGERLPILGTSDDLEAVLVHHPVDEVYLTGPLDDAPELTRVAGLCDELGVRLSLDANFLGNRTSRALLRDFDGWSLLTFASGPADGLDLALKRAMDLVGAAVGLALSAPLLALLAAAIRLDDGGPVLFVQERVGRFGRPFSMLKLRTMEVGAEERRPELAGANELEGPAFKMAGDPRITRVGRLLRRTSLDELPQLVNVLRGEMSLVGPRPPLPEEVARYARWQLRKLSMRPGITCIWQVSGRSELPFEEWLELDLRYIDTWSLGLDLWLLLRTVPAVLSGRGAR